MVLKRKDTSELVARQELEHEARLLLGINHPHVARCFGAFHDEGGRSAGRYAVYS